MSIEASKAVWALRGLSPTEKLVLVCLADFANGPEARCWPSVQLLAERCGLKERAVREIMRRLRDDGRIVEERRGGGRGRPTVYRIVLSTIRVIRGGRAEPAGAGATTQENPAPQNTVPPASIPDGNPASDDAETLHPHAPEPIREPSGARASARERPRFSSEALKTAARIEQGQHVDNPSAEALRCAMRLFGVSAIELSERGYDVPNAVIEAAVPLDRGAPTGPP